MALPGDHLIPEGHAGGTMATTIKAPPSAVWPRLVQMGCDRAGFYSWDRLDNGGRPSAQSIHSEWQDLAQGGPILSVPDGSFWFGVAVLEPERTLVLRASFSLTKPAPFDPRFGTPRAYSDSLWGFHLRPAGDGATRLIFRGPWAARPAWAQRVSNWLFWEPATGSCRSGSSPGCAAGRRGRCERALPAGVEAEDAHGRKRATRGCKYTRAMPESVPNRYSVAIEFDADEGSSEIAQLITEAFSSEEPPLARPQGVRAAKDTVIVEFRELNDDLPMGREGASPPRGHHAVSELSEMHALPSTVVPAVRALVALSEARARAGLSPRQRLVIEVNPEPHPGQERFDPLEDE